MASITTNSPIQMLLVSHAKRIDGLVFGSMRIFQFSVFSFPFADQGSRCLTFAVSGLRDLPRYQHIDVHVSLHRKVQPNNLRRDRIRIRNDNGSFEVIERNL